MKITVEHEIPDENSCRTCRLNDTDGDKVTFCEAFRMLIIENIPCPACMEARKRRRDEAMDKEIETEAYLNEEAK